MYEDSWELKAGTLAVNACVPPSSVDGSQLTVMTRAGSSDPPRGGGAGGRAAGRAARLAVERGIRCPLLLISAANHVVLGLGSA